MNNNIENETLLEGTVAIKTTVYSFVKAKGKDANDIIKNALEICAIDNSKKHDFIDCIPEALGLHMTNKNYIKMADAGNHLGTEDVIRDIVESSSLDECVF